MKPTLRKLTITAHVAFSVGWLGAVAPFLVLSIAGLTSHDAEVVRGAYLSMDLISRFIIIPMCFAALATGLLQALAARGRSGSFTPSREDKNLLCGPRVRTRASGGMCFPVLCTSEPRSRAARKPATCPPRAPPDRAERGRPSHAGAGVPRALVVTPCAARARRGTSRSHPPPPFPIVGGPRPLRVVFARLRQGLQDRGRIARISRRHRHRHHRARL